MVRIYQLDPTADPAHREAIINAGLSDDQCYIVSRWREYHHTEKTARLKGCRVEIVTPARQRGEEPTREPVRVRVFLADCGIDIDSSLITAANPGVPFVEQSDGRKLFCVAESDDFAILHKLNDGLIAFSARFQKRGVKPRSGLKGSKAATIARFTDAIERILRDRKRGVDRNGKHMGETITHEDIAEYSGLRRETVTKLLKLHSLDISNLTPADK
jgi:hypothetical protein